MPKGTSRKSVNSRSRTKPATTPRAGKPKLLSGGNPQIAKAYGDAPVQAYIDAMPGWKRDVGHRLDALITRAVPGVRKAVKYNSPLYGLADPEAESEAENDLGWFLGIHCFAAYIKVGFFSGAALRPLPPGASKQKNVRYLDLREGDLGGTIDEDQFVDWVKQASCLPGEKI